MNTMEKKVDALINLCLCEDPVEKEFLRKSLREMVEEPEAPTSVDYHDKVVKALLELGTPDHIKGHRYLLHIIEMVIKNPEIHEQVTKVLYPETAKVFNTTPSRVERAVRHAIEVTWDRGDVDVLTKYFGNTINIHKGKPTNSEFFSRMANALR